MRRKRQGGLLLFLMALAMTTLACGLFGAGEDEIPSDAEVVTVVANASLRPWLGSAVPTFNENPPETAAGDPVFVVVDFVESGQAVTELAGGAEAALWLPEERVWVNVLADQGNGDFQGDCASVAESPLVIAMWRPAAEALGWPGLPLGWLDVGSLAADPSAWSYYSGGELGDSFRLAHTHPGLSGSGASTLLALVQSAEAKTEAVTPEDIQQPIVQASVGAFESGVTTFSPSTDVLGATMRERGVDYLTAAVMYENVAVFYGNGEIVPIYPLEGTFVADHPACINQAAPAAVQEGAQLFRDYLRDVAAQETAVSVGLRPVNDAVAIPPGGLLDSTQGVDLAEPAVVFSSPTVEALYGVQEVWQAARKPVNLVMLLDTSGSMRGGKMDGMRTAAIQFVEQMGEEDRISLIAFETEPYLLIENALIGEARDEVVGLIAGLEASGDTTLFDAIGDGAGVIARTESVATTNAMVVLTDGQDTRSYRFRFDAELITAATSFDTTIFTIAYGSDADEQVLSELAARGNGTYYVGDEASIAAIYDEMSAAFGGSVGFGR
ncbi:MAG: VWA domain-containing protein [Anaerolineales bacterium]|nr:VWA domain-containing protein [Anaerolineales bacterium]